MITYNWVINQLQCLVDYEGMNDVINVIHWSYIAVDGEYTANVYGSTNVEQPNPQNFIPYQDVTEAEVIGWLEQILPVADMQVSLAANIELQINPVEITLPLPWLSV